MYEFPTEPSCCFHPCYHDGALVFVAYLDHIYRRLAGGDWPTPEAISLRPGEKLRIATSKNNPFTNFSDTWTRNTGHRKLADFLKVIEKQRADPRNENNAPDRRDDRNERLIDAIEKGQSK